MAWSRLPMLVLFFAAFTLSAGSTSAARDDSPTHQSCFQRICQDPKPYVDCLQKTRLALEDEKDWQALRERAAARGLVAPAQELRLGSERKDVGSPVQWVHLTDDDDAVWADVLRYPSSADAKAILQGSGGWYAGSLGNDAHHYFTLEAQSGRDAAALTVRRNRYVFNFGVKVPVAIRRPDGEKGNRPADYRILNDGLDQLLGFAEIVLQLIVDPSQPVWIPKANPNDDDLRALRTASFCRLWSEVKRSFVFAGERPALDGSLTRDRGPDWETLLEPTLQRIARAENDDEYVRILQETVALLEDGHTRVFPNEPLTRAPVLITWVEEKPIVIDVADGVSGLQKGMEILEVDGMNVESYLREQVRPIQFSSTPHHRDVVTCQRLLDGPLGTVRHLKVVDEEGVESECEVVVDGKGGEALWRRPPAIEYREVEEGIAYVALNTFSTSEVVEAFDEVFPKILDADALILDVRRNGGGDSGNGYAIMGRLIDETCSLTSVWRTRQYRAAHAAWQEEETWVDGTHGTVEPRGDYPFEGDVIVLIGPNTFSAAEDFLVPMKASGRAVLIGEATGGSTGQPLGLSLYKAFAQICTKWDRFPDGTEFAGVGVKPDIEVRLTVDDIRQGRDPVLLAALEYL